jgi:hypothetical protein
MGTFAAVYFMLRVLTKGPVWDLSSPSGWWFRFVVFSMVLE